MIVCDNAIDSVDSASLAICGNLPDAESMLRMPEHLVEGDSSKEAGMARGLFEGAGVMLG